MRHWSVIFLLLLSCVLGLALVFFPSQLGAEQRSAPVPQPVPSPKLRRLRISTPQAESKQTLIVGLPHAVAGEGTVYLKEANGSLQVSAPSTETGTFSLLFPTSRKIYKIWFENQQGKSKTIELPLAKPIYVLPLNPSNSMEGVLTPLNNGQVRVSNDLGPGKPPIFEVLPYVEVIVANYQTGAVVTSKTDGEGRFSVIIAGVAKERIMIFVSDLLNKNITSDFLELTVPASR